MKFQHCRECWRINTTTWRLHTKAWNKTDYSHQKPYWQHMDQQNDNNQKTKRQGQLYERFKWLISNISCEKIWTCLRKGNIKREMDSLRAAQNKSIKTNHIKARIDKSQQNSKCWLCGNGDEAINHIINKYSKLAKKEYKTRRDWAGKVIHWELCKKLKFEHTKKWYMHNPILVLENTHTNTSGSLTSKRIT